MSALAPSSRSPRSAPLAVARVAGAYRAVAATAVAAGEPILVIQGVLVDRPSRYSVQVGASLHIDLPREHRIEDEFDNHPWRFLNHSCDPSSSLQGRMLIARRDLQPWEEITFDYDTTEYELACPFECSCGASTCRGFIRGFRHLDVATRARLHPLLAEHLRG